MHLENPLLRAVHYFLSFKDSSKPEYNRLSFNKYSPKSKRSQHGVDFDINMLSNRAEAQVPLMSCVFSRKKEVYS